MSSKKGHQMPQGTRLYLISANSKDTSEIDGNWQSSRKEWNERLTRDTLIKSFVPNECLTEDGQTFSLGEILGLISAQVWNAWKVTISAFDTFSMILWLSLLLWYEGSCYPEAQCLSYTFCIQGKSEEKDRFKHWPSNITY